MWAFVLLAAVRRHRGVRLERRADRRGGAALAAGADRRNARPAAVILIFMTNMLTPVAFAAFVALTGRYDCAFLVAGALQPDLPAAALRHRPRSAKARSAEPRRVAAPSRKC